MLPPIFHQIFPLLSWTVISVFIFHKRRETLAVLRGGLRAMETRAQQFEAGCEVGQSTVFTPGALLESEIQYQSSNKRQIHLHGNLDSKMRIISFFLV